MIDYHIRSQGSSFRIRFRHVYSIHSEQGKLYSGSSRLVLVPHDRLFFNLSLMFENVDVVLPT